MEIKYLTTPNHLKRNVEHVLRVINNIVLKLRKDLNKDVVDYLRSISEELGKVDVMLHYRDLDEINIKHLLTLKKIVDKIFIVIKNYNTPCIEYLLSLNRFLSNDLIPGIYFHDKITHIDLLMSRFDKILIILNVKDFVKEKLILNLKRSRSTRIYLLMIKPCVSYEFLNSIDTLITSKLESISRLKLLKNLNKRSMREYALRYGELDTREEVLNQDNLWKFITQSNVELIRYLQIN